MLPVVAGPAAEAWLRRGARSFMQTPANVTWIKVDPPSFDLWGVLASSLSLTGLLALMAVLLGAGLGVMLIRRRRRQATAHGQHLSLQG